MHNYTNCKQRKYKENKIEKVFLFKTSPSHVLVSVSKNDFKENKLSLR